MGALPLRQAAKIGAYVVKKELSGGKSDGADAATVVRCPPWACAGCGKIIITTKSQPAQALRAGSRRLTLSAPPPFPIAAARPCSTTKGPKIVQGYIAGDSSSSVHQRRAAGQEDRPTSRHPNFTWSIPWTATRRFTTIRLQYVAPMTAHRRI